MAHGDEFVSSRRVFGPFEFAGRSEDCESKRPQKYEVLPFAQRDWPL